MNGRKRHLLVDTQGGVLKAWVPAADVAERDGGRLLREAFPPAGAGFARLRHRWVDAAYRGGFVDGVRSTWGGSVEVVKQGWTGVSTVGVFPGQEPPEKPTGFQVLTWRGMVERPCAWIGFYRRRSKDDAYLPETSEAMVSTVMRRLMLARLAARTP